MRTSLHVHTTHSDGETDVALTVARARAIGIEELGISDHLVLPDGQPPWAMGLDEVGAYVEDVRRWRDHPHPRVRLGVEVDWLPEHAGLLARVLDGMGLDYAIGSVHVVEGLHADHATMARRAPTVRTVLLRRYWELVRSMAASGLVEVVGHLDLPKGGEDASLQGLREAALDAIAASDMAVELNTSGWHKSCRGPYPERSLLLACHARGIPALVTSDAHLLDHLDRDLDRGAAALWEAGYREVARFVERKRIMEPLVVPRAPSPW